MYYWRQLTEEQRKEVLRERMGRDLPWHSPPHIEFTGEFSFIITAACYEHKHIVGRDPNRMAEFESRLIEACVEAEAEILAWCVLPNHYHILIRTKDIKRLRKALGQLHGRTSMFWNREDHSVGRKVWFNFFDRDMRSNRHFWATMNYIHNNAVHHGYAARWQEWPYSSAARFQEEKGAEEASRIWKKYPVLDYGKDWDIY